ncbi:MAG: multifunctional oxoglutarate decarboxylase/oxoglutarate dehydrogenase thiamine pyrophosphate-binding subunit/dihydrolipoyllysine-residue succinyltransferase subunit [Bacteroidetes bacterium]|nr:multifunctional oxoglutarate decarboxylase/oxoglutarate dehydrogenase thiamine pyrophosphate-binding subunit/dihydrolipoyllysine-residue succinyltransferase subunit [Bacteroidota bacterium]MCW5895571.1 multifunctional oxoglutarate decarboxylase/oxoglutarate dehydrogenase thiamine pyrophosphate-binding subunit/dihydrolipoyllysine-residue succinyltransferase subunit [Bacteroidota bacterium]
MQPTAGQLQAILEEFGPNAGLVEEMLEEYLKNPASVSKTWQHYFAAALGAKQEGGNGSQSASPLTLTPSYPQVTSTSPEPSDQSTAIRGVAAKIVENMEASLALPTATSVRTIPVKVLEENRRLLNQYLAVRTGGKLSFTHIISWAMVKALGDHPNLNASFARIGGVPHKTERPHVNVGLAVDVTRKDGTRSLIVPNIKNAEAMNFAQFVAAYDDIIRKSRSNALDPSDFQGTSITLTNPGTVGTVASIPRLMPGQGAIIATGAINHPAENHGMSLEALSVLGISKVMTMTCTYDHRVIQGAESGQFLARVHELLLGEEKFYDSLFADLEIPYEPVRWQTDQHPAFACASQTEAYIEKQARVLQLINAYRVRGHLIAHLDPLVNKPGHHNELDPAFYGLTIWDLDREFITGGLGGKPRATLREILDILRETYCGTIGVEYMNIQHTQQKQWLQERMEPARNQHPLTNELRKQILKKLTAAEGLEKFLHTKFIGHKRFSLEGGETMMAILDVLLDEAAETGVKEAVIGMAHRGRLNILANTIGKPLAKLFSEFEGYVDPSSTQGSGDVKYHLGASGMHRNAAGREIAVSVAPNPSHLEAVNPVVEGIVRAKQERLGDAEHQQIIPILIHGDAAFAGQGTIAETLNLSQLHGYRTGGTIHLIINNQIGFTTTPEDARSTPYCTDVAKMVQAPIFHVNGDDPEACVRVARLALEYRKTFNKDVVIDMFCYRRHGHNEGDEPSYTQPLLYKKIKQHPSVRQLYVERLLRQKLMTKEELDAITEESKQRYERAFEASQKREMHFRPDVPLAVAAEELAKAQPGGGTAISIETLHDVTRALTTLPARFAINPKLQRILDERALLLEGDAKIDWAFAEALAFGSLVAEGTPVRLSGQDSGRGTFSQRHAVLYDATSGAEYVPLNHIREGQAPFAVYDSLLSEAAVLGFEFGYSVADPLALVLWEAQFGDFANGAQMIIDQFLAGSEAKWQEPCDLVLLLPHGYEGQGPEHSSARLERFLQLCAEDNMQVVNVTTPAQYFHVLRRQMRDNRRKPLVIMTPKSLLRHPKVVSHQDDFLTGRFQELLDDSAITNPAGVKRVVFCSGKIYYDLLAEQALHPNSAVAIVRLEQFYPFAAEQVAAVLRKYSNAAEVVWCQEEPQNMGAWTFVQPHLTSLLSAGQHLDYAGRKASAATATGSLKAHQAEQDEVVKSALL